MSAARPDYQTERLVQLSRDRPNGAAYQDWRYRAEYEELLAKNTNRGPIPTEPGHYAIEHGTVRQSGILGDDGHWRITGWAGDASLARVQQAFARCTFTRLEPVSCRLCVNIGPVDVSVALSDRTLTLPHAVAREAFDALGVALNQPGIELLNNPDGLDSEPDVWGEPGEMPTLPIDGGKVFFYIPDEMDDEQPARLCDGDGAHERPYCVMLLQYGVGDPGSHLTDEQVNAAYFRVRVPVALPDIDPV